MSRLSIATPILDAADRWRRQCLLDGGSLFDGEPLWTADYFAELQRYFVDRPDEGSRSFEEKLRDQLEPASPQARRLWAEITWLYYLLVISVRPATKLDRIRRVYQWSGTEFREDHWALGEDILGGGIVHPGIGFAAHQWREFSFIVTLMCHWTSRPTRERQSLLRDPWEFAKWVDANPDGYGRQFRHALLFLLFPDQFEPIMSVSNKKAIVKAFREQTGDYSDVDQLDRIGLDQALLATRSRLQQTQPGREVDFFDAPFRDVWHESSPPVTNDDQTDPADAEAWYRDRFGEADAWAMAPGDGARLWEDFLKHGIAAIGWDSLGDLREYATRDDIHSELIKNGAGDNPWNQSLATWEFAHKMKIGDIVLAKRGRNGILGWGEVTGNYVHDSDRSEYLNTRSVTWHPCQTPIELKRPITTKALTIFTPYKDWLRNIFALVDAAQPPIDHPHPFGIADALSELFIEEAQLSRILDSISIRKNLILQGPPGVGKTYISRRIAWCLTGYRDAPSIEMVQFHQSYAYEDFVQGWRPTESGGFTLRNGVFFEFCKRAEQHPDVRFVFIIDEINRGNLSRIFGELLMLIEADKRGPDHAIALTYSVLGKRFSVPANVYLLGLMNTADRSLAIVDYALRRRFAFETLTPAYRTGKFREYLLEADVDRRLVDRIQNNLDEVNSRIRDNKDLGAGFAIGHSYFVPDTTADEAWYSTVIETQIAPLMREYWFDHPEKAEELVETLRQ